MSEEPPSKPISVPSFQSAENSKKDFRASQLEGKVIHNLKLLKSLIRGEKVRLIQFEQSGAESKDGTNSSVNALKERIINQFMHFDIEGLAALSVPKKLQSECLDLLIQAWRKKIAKDFSQVLTLLNLKFSKESIRALVIALSLSVELKALRIDHCQLGVFEAKLLAVFIKVHPTITVLHLNHNPLTDEGFLSIAAALLYNDTLKNLSLNETDLGDESVEKIIELINQDQYQSISIKDNRFTESAQLTLKEKAYEKDCELFLE